MQKKSMKKISIFVLFISLGGCSQNPVTWWKSVNQKVKHLVTVEAKYEALKKDHEKLQTEFYHVEHEYVTLKAEIQSKKSADLSLTLTGSKEGRGIASIRYEPPKGLAPKDLVALAYEHLREKRFPEAAASFDALISQPESASLQKTDVFYSAGVAWYQVKNYSKARENFETARQHAEGEEKEKVHKKVDLWMRAIDRKLASTTSHHGGE